MPDTLAADLVAASWSELSPGLQKFVIGLVACQLLLMTVALVLWRRTPADRMPGPDGTSKRLWLVVIVFGQILGSIAFMAMRTRPAPGVDGADVDGADVDGAERSDPRRRSVDVTVETLYGGKEGR